MTREFVDTHFHLWDKSNTQLRYAWLDPEAVSVEHGSLDPIKAPKYDLQAFRAETRFSGLVKAVHVAAAKGSPDPVLEDDWLESVAAPHGMPQAIVAYCGLAGSDVAASLERHAAHRLVRGIRDLDAVRQGREAAFRAGFQRLADFGMLFEFDSGWQGLPVAAHLARRFPGTQIVLDHGGFRRSTDPDHFQCWRASLADLAQHENVACKISGLGLIEREWTFATVRPWILSAIDMFGTDRCFFGTNWPVDRMYSSYDAVVDTYAAVIQDFADGEQRALFRGNAERWYRI